MSLGTCERKRAFMVWREEFVVVGGEAEEELKNGQRKGLGGQDQKRWRKGLKRLAWRTTDDLG
jgi:hypothetical protein